jgi:hypothetical protein
MELYRARREKTRDEEVAGPVVAAALTIRPDPPWQSGANSPGVPRPLCRVRCAAGGGSRGVVD